MTDSVRMTRLDNGIRVVTEAMPHLKTASLGIWAGAGARNEALREHGISHLLEHMAFKGTQRRSAAQIAEEIEQVGGDLNAMTGHESTAYYARVLAEDVPLGLDILSDILTHSVFDETELAREQNVIVQEIGAAYDTPAPPTRATSSAGRRGRTGAPAAARGDGRRSPALHYGRVIGTGPPVPTPHFPSWATTTPAWLAKQAFG